MKKILLSLSLIIAFSAVVQAQKKSELIAEISTLKSQLDSVNNQVAEAQRKEKASLAKAESFEAQALELRDANKTLMKNLNSFSQLSSQNSTNMNKAMEALNVKERQLKAINDAIASNDSTALVVLTNAKQTLGENAKIGVSNGMVIISSSLTSLFESDTEATITPEAEPWVQKIGQILVANPNMAVTIEGLSMTGNLDLPAQQASAVSSALQRLEIAADRITALGKDGNLKEGVVIKIHPKFDEFYKMVKESMKNGS
ncbi:OmpA family protein [Maribacter sp. 2308TA10-17]|uniref:OmpA family protein n=1 Tax=Maribacter sp. 2308TA10-17 TaxID=3386276 RepID=UPI0039BCE23F